MWWLQCSSSTDSGVVVVSIVKQSQALCRITPKPVLCKILIDAPFPLHMQVHSLETVLFSEAIYPQQNSNWNIDKKVQLFHISYQIGVLLGLWTICDKNYKYRVCHRDRTLSLLHFCKIKSNFDRTGSQIGDFTDDKYCFQQAEIAAHRMGHSCTSFLTDIIFCSGGLF